MLTFYGKGLARPESVVTVFSPPGEDSAAFLTQQRSQHLWSSTQIDWFAFEWGRPALLAESLVGTETRYAFNVTRFLMDRSQLAVFFNKNVGIFSFRFLRFFKFNHLVTNPFAFSSTSFYNDALQHVFPLDSFYEFSDK